MLSRALLVDPFPPPAPDRAGEPADGVVRQSERLAELADSTARPVAVDGGGDTGAVAAIFGIDVLDHLLPPQMLEIHVDIGWLIAGGGDEALEQQVGARRVNGGDAQAVAHR